MKKRALLVLVIVLVMVSVVALSGCAKKKDEDVSSSPSASNPDAAASTSKGDTMSEFVIEDVIVGEGAEATAGKTISVHYTGTLTDGTKFDSSVDRGTPFEFRLGAGQVIEGWDKGFDGMKVGGRRKLTIPGNMAYGDRGAGGIIGPDATLLFDVELLAVK